MLLVPELVLGAFLVVISGLIILSANGFFGFVSPTGIFYGLFVVFIYIGTVLIHYDVTLPYAVPVESHPLLLGSAIFLFALGTAFPNLLLGFEPFRETKGYAEKQPTPGLNTNIRIAVMSVAGVLILWITIIYFRSGSPLLSTISFRSWVAAHSWPMLGITLFLPFITLLILVYGYSQQEVIIWRAGMIAFAATLIFMLLTSRRYPILDFGIWTICLISYLRFKNYFEMTRILLLSALVGIPFIVGISLIRSPGALENTLAVGWRRLRNRIFLSQATGINYIFTTFPRTHDYFGVEFLLDRIVSILPGYGYGRSFGETLYNEVFTGRGGFLPPTLIGRLYISLGKIGLIGLFVWGALLQTIFIVFVRIKKTPLIVVLFAICSGLLGRSLIQGFLAPTNTIKYLVVFSLPLVLLALKLPEIKIAIQSEH